MAANRFTAKGNLADSPTLKTVKGGRDGEFEVANMRVRFSRYGQDEKGNVIEKGGFWREVEIYGQKARDVAQHIRKGTRVLVIGEEREYTGKNDDGTEVEVFKIVAEDITIVPVRIEKIIYAAPTGQHRKQENEAAQQQAASNPSTPPMDRHEYEAQSQYNDDVPY